MRGQLLAIAMISCVGSIPAAVSVAVASSPGPSPAQIGKKHFIRCVACHATDASARPMTGPHLEGIVGRPAASLAFAYSDWLRAQDFVWDEARLDAFLEAPRALNPDMCPTFAGIPKAEDRAALIAFLKAPGR